MSLPAAHPLADGRTGASPVVRAYRGERIPAPPVWFPELPVPHGAGPRPAAPDPGRIAELTAEPVRKHGVDAVALAVDVMTPVLLGGARVRTEPGRGPVVDEPVRTASDVLRLRPLDPALLEPVRAAVALAVAELGSTPLVAVGAAPFTVGSVLVEGGPSGDQLRARSLMYTDPHTWAALLNWCADVTGAFLRTQVEAGASAVLLTDHAMGSLSRRDYQRRVAPHSRRAFDALRGIDVPRVHAGLGSADLLDLLPGIGAQVAGIDWRLPLDEASARLGGMALQGNLDPALLAAPWPTLRAHIDDVVARGAAAPAHVLSLGGGVPSGTDPDVLTRIAAYVHGG